MRDSGTNLSEHKRKTQNTGEVSFQMRGEEMSHQFINVEKKGHISILTMNRPEVLNAIHPMISREMSEAINEFDEDPQQWVMIVTGAGERAFSAGNDLKFTASHGASKVKELMQGVKGGFGGITNRHDCHKPFIAAVNGFAFGGGFEIALACDIIIASENALFSFPEPRVGSDGSSGRRAPSASQDSLPPGHGNAAHFQQGWCGTREGIWFCQQSSVFGATDEHGRSLCRRNHERRAVIDSSQ